MASGWGFEGVGVTGSAWSVAVWRAGDGGEVSARA